MSNKKKPEKMIRYRDSISGTFVKKAYADRNPRTTERQHIRKATGPSMSSRKK